MAVEVARAEGWTADTEATGTGEPWEADVLAQMVATMARHPDGNEGQKKWACNVEV